MSGPLWAKAGAVVDGDAMAFMAGDDLALDRVLLPYDIQGTRAHVRGLGRAGLLPERDVGSIIEVLDELAESTADGRFTLEPPHEDSHSAIEAFLTERLGDTGARVHLGRSRNDQVATATRLYMKHVLAGLGEGLIRSAKAALSRALRHEHDPMPGYTHLQRAVPSSVGLWMASFAESFADSAELALLTREWLDSSPLGSAAGYGVNLTLDREGVAEELGFSRVQLNPMSVQAARGKFECQVLAVLWQAAQDVRRLAWDLTLFSSQEFGFVTLGPTHSTGSSIMPNKRNPDMSELLRGLAAEVAGQMAAIQQATALPSGYHRDLQVTKGPLITASQRTLAAFRHVPSVIEQCEFHLDRMAAAIDAPMYATDRAVELAASGLSFREAYRQVAAELAQGDRPGDAGESLRARVSPGGCGDLRLDAIRTRLDTLAARL